MILAKAVRVLTGIAALACGSAAGAGPPYITDDPDPTELGHWEIYNFADFGVDQGDLLGSTGLDLNYGPLEGVQLTATLPLAIDTRSRPHVASGEVELGLKYRFVHDATSGVSIAIFPRVFLPTAPGGGRASLLLPVWAGIERGKWTLFGGGGYRLRSGRGARNSAIAAIALTRAVSQRLVAGMEIAHEGGDSAGVRGTTTIDAGSIVTLSKHWSLLLSGGPVREDGSGRLTAHLYAALGLNF